MLKLSKELTEQALQNPTGVPCQGDGVADTFMVVSTSVWQLLRRAAEQTDANAIEAGIRDMECGRVQSAEEARQHGRDELVSRFRQ